MKLKKIPTDGLREILRDTERAAGSESQSATIIRRELERREHGKQEETSEVAKEVSHADQ